MVSCWEVPKRPLHERFPLTVQKSWSYFERVQFFEKAKKKQKEILYTTDMTLAFTSYVKYERQPYPYGVRYVKKRTNNYISKKRYTHFQIKPIKKPLDKKIIKKN